MAQEMAKQTTKKMAQPIANVADNDKRSGSTDRRITAEDRRNTERVAEDLTPRRDPDVKDRRHTTVVRRAAAH
jgi:hypothetical protein